MRSASGLILVLVLAACAKQEPPPASSTAAGGKPASPPESVITAEAAPGSASVQATAPKAPPVLTTATLSPAPTNTSTAAPKPEDSPSGDAVKTSTPTETAPKDGAAIFSQICATCHMADGYGVPYLQPKIKDSAWISNPDPQPLLSLILRGSAILGEASKAYENDMAPQDHLTDAEIAAVASYVRQRFAVKPITEPVTPAQVAIARSRPGLP